MGLIVEVADFTGRFQIPTDNDRLNAVINSWEKYYLKQLLGIELYKLFAADITAHVPGTLIYQNIFNPIEQDFNQEILISEGIKIMLLGFLYWEYVREVEKKLSTVGFIANTSDVSKPIAIDFTQTNNKYNDAVTSFETIQWYIRDQNITTYPLYNGQEIKRTHWAL